MNKRFLMIGAAVLALGAAGVAAIADTPPSAPRAERHHRFGDIDANRDGFVTRAEVQAQTERVFDEMDTNDDAKIDGADRGRFERRIVEKRVVRTDEGKGKGIQEEIEEEVRIEHGGGPGDGERRVIVRKHDGKEGRHHGRGGHHMRGGMPFMMLMHSDEADTNGDGALSRQEMVTQHLRFFDAGDANGDGKIKFDPPAPAVAPTPPPPPTAPTAPTPPAAPKR